MICFAPALSGISQSLQRVDSWLTRQSVCQSFKQVLCQSVGRLVDLVMSRPETPSVTASKDSRPCVAITVLIEI